MSKTMKVFIGAIAGMGVLRFILNMNGVPNETVKYFSMTAIILIASVYFAIVTTTHKERLKAAYLIILPYMLIEVLALGYTWISGRQTIFHTPPYTFGVSIGTHTIGHLVGGLTWEPLIIFVQMEIIWYVYDLARSTIYGSARTEVSRRN
jgi:hypothetical protein